MGLFWLRSIRNNFQPYFFSIAVHRQRSVTEWLEVTCSECLCPACRQYKLNGLKISGMEGFCNRATHNLWILLEEARLIEEHLYNSGNYKEWYKPHLDNTIYRPLIAQIVENLESSKEVGKG